MVEMEQPVDILICQNLHLMELDIVLLPMDNPDQDNTYKEGIIRQTEVVDHPQVEQGVEVKVEVGVHHAWNQSNVQFPGHMVAHAVMEHWKMLENKVFSVVFAVISFL